MHIEPGMATGAKLVLSYATGAVAAGCVLKLAVNTVCEQGVASFVARTVTTTALAFSFFELLPHFRIGVSDVHFILGSTLFPLFGMVPAAFGLALGLLLQGLFFAPTDLPQYDSWRWQSRCSASRSMVSSLRACTMPPGDDLNGGRGGRPSSK